MKQLLILFAVILTSISCKNDKNVYGVDCSDNKTIAPQSEIDYITNYINGRNENGDCNIQVANATLVNNKD